MTAPAIPAPAPKGRLGNGQLRRQVAEWLAARPGPHTVGEIAKDLGRSAGAVGNALTTLADRAEASASPASRCATRPTPRPPPQPPPSPPRPLGSRPAQGRPCRAAAGSLAGRAEAGHPASAAGRAEGPRPEGRARPDHPPGRAGIPAPRAGRDGRCRGAAHAARRGSAGPAGRAARHGQDEPGRGGLPRPDHGGRGRRHHGGGFRRRVHPEAGRHVRVHLRAADQGDAGRPGAVHR
jgi:hypothetical protein